MTNHATVFRLVGSMIRDETTPGALATPEPGASPTNRSRLMPSLAHPGCPEPTDDHKSSHPRRVIPAPPDGCPECLIHDNYPVVSWYEGEGDDLSVEGIYCCQSCGHIWRCGWLVRAL